jgi:hypothetical protein
VSLPTAHIAGLPLEEGLPSVAPAAAVAVILIRARLRGLGAWRRRR